MGVTIRARGHENVTAQHASTFEVTRDDYLTPAGDCIIGIEADRAPAEFDRSFVAACRDADASIVVTIAVDDLVERVRGRGHPALSFADDRSAVFRTSEYVDDRTVLVGADKAASDLDRELVDRIAGGAPVTLSIEVANGNPG